MTNHPIKILCSTRIRLTDEQRKILKSAYKAKQAEATPAPAPTVLPGSTIAVQHAPTNTAINSRLGMPPMVVLDLLNSRESISLPTVLHLQKELEATVLTKEDLTKAWKSYVDYIFNKTNDD